LAKEAFSRIGLQLQRSKPIAYNVTAAKIAFAEQRYTDALTFLEEAENPQALLANYEKNFSSDVIYELRSKVYEALDKPALALAAYKQFLIMKDSIEAAEEEVRFAQINFKVQKDKELQDLAAANLAQELENKQSIQQLWLIFGIVSIVLLFLYILRTRRNLKTKLALDHAQHVSEMKNNLIENLSHEFRTPLTIILGYLELIQNNTIHPEKISHHAKIAMNNGNQLIERLNNLLTLLRSEDGVTSKKRIVTSHNMGKFLNELVTDFAGIAQMHNVDLYFKSNLKTDANTIDFEYNNLTKVVTNLISNAIKFSKPQSEVHVASVLTEKLLTIVVKDQGIGISALEKEKIFDRFYQAESHTKSGGFGIGLSLVKTLVDQWNGTIEVDSNTDIGTTFTLKIPMPITDHSAYAFVETPVFEKLTHIEIEELHSATPKSNLPKILIVEDNSEMTSYYQEILSASFQCIFALNGKEALKKLEVQAFDLIISDLKMPLMNGFEFKAILNTNKTYKDIPFIMISASPIDYSVEERITLQIDEYIMKPFSAVEIISRIRLLIEGNMYSEKVFNITDKKVEFEGSFTKLMEKINSVIIENINNTEFSVEALASACGYSEKQLTRILKSNIGLTPVKVILEIRLLKAYEMLKNMTRQTIGEVIYEVGFNNRSYFYRAFFKRFGIKPGELFKQYKNSVH